MALTDQLTAYWKFNESSGNAVDSSGNARTLTNNATATYVAGLLGNAVHLVGSSSQYMNRGDTSGTTAGGTISISLWVKVNTAPASNASYTLGDVASSGTTPFVAYIIDYFNNAGTLQLRANRQREAVSNNVISVNVDLSTGVYHHVVLTYDATSLTLYRNGSAVAGPTAESGAGTGPNGTDETDFGQLHSVQGNFATVDIDEAGIWSRALSSAEVTSLYNGGAGLTYPFTTGTATVITSTLPTLQVG